MMKLYSASILHAIQSAIDNNEFKMTTYKDNTFLDNQLFVSAEISIKFFTNPDTNRRDAYMITTNCDLKSDYITDWDHHTAAGKFLIKDYKKDRRDFVENSLYHMLELTINNEPVKILVRLLDDIYMPDITEVDIKEMKSLFGDIVIDNKIFSVVKIMLATGNFRSYDKFKSLDSIVSSSIESNESFIEGVDTEDDDTEAENIPDDSASPEEGLF